LKAINKVRRIDPVNPRPDIIDEAARIIKDGGVVVFPTRSLYGLGADALNVKAVIRVFRIKRRPGSKPILVLIKNKNEMDRLVENIPRMASVIMENFWSGRVSIVFKAKKGLSADLTAGTGKIGIRLPGHNVASALVNAAEGPITGTSANLSGSAGCFQIDNLDTRIADRVDLILDAGPLRGGTGSTIVDATGDTPLILREGEISKEDIEKVIKQ